MISKLTNKVASYVNPKNLKNISDQRIAEGFLWGVPAVVVPLRQSLDKDRQGDERKELRYRDIITYTLGPLSYFAGEGAAKSFLNNTRVKALNSLGNKSKIAASMGIGMLCFMSWATFGAVKLAKYLVNRDKEKTEAKNDENPFEKAALDTQENPVKKTMTSIELHTPDKENPYYLYNYSQSQSFGNNDPFGRFRRKTRQYG